MYFYSLPTIREHFLNRLNDVPSNSGKEHALQCVTNLIDDTPEHKRFSLIQEIGTDKAEYQETVLSNWNEKNWRKEHIAVYNEVLAALKKRV